MKRRRILEVDTSSSYTTPVASGRQTKNRAEVFGLGEVAEAAGAPLSRVKDWTIGRPLLIAPSILAASGTGTRNLYSRDDVYLMALVNRLNEGGLSPLLIQDLLNLLEGYGGDVREHLGEMTGMKLIVGEGGRLKNVQWWRAPRNRPPFISDLPPSVLGEYAINLRHLWRQVNKRIQKLAKARSGSKRRA